MRKNCLFIYQYYLLCLSFKKSESDISQSWPVYLDLSNGWLEWRIHQLNCVNQRSERVRDHPEIMIWTVQCWHQTIYHLHILDLLTASDLSRAMVNIEYFIELFEILSYHREILKSCFAESFPFTVNSLNTIHTIQYSCYQQFFGSFCNNSGIDCFKRTWIIISKSFIHFNRLVGWFDPSLYLCTDRGRAQKWDKIVRLWQVSWM